EAAVSRTIAGRALAGTGQKDRAVAELQRAAAALDACGAWRYRQSAEHELGKLGHRPHRRTRPGNANGAGIEALTGRELQVARLVADRNTNPQIARELFLSQKTVEPHPRNIFHQMGVTARAALARAVECTDPIARSAPHSGPEEPKAPDRPGRKAPVQGNASLPRASAGVLSWELMKSEPRSPRCVTGRYK